MENKEFFKVLYQIADILEIQNENVFRIRSYRKAGQALESVSFNIDRAARENPDAISELSGIGSTIFSIIMEICQTGQCAEHQRLLAVVPLSLLEMSRLPGVGPKKVALFRDRGIRSLSELAEAAQRHELRNLPGIGEKIESRILKAIREQEQTSGQFRIHEALAVAEQVIRHMQEAVNVARISAAGSVRRWKETVADVDVLVASEDPLPVMSRFVDFPPADQILARGETKSSIALSSGMQVDLRVLPQPSFGAALQYFTGSKEHNVILRERAKRMGFKVNEYGVFRISDEVQVAGAQEEDVYRLLGLQFIPPELRENRGEIEAAQAEQLPRLVEESDIRGDLHMHTVASDGKNTVQEMAAAAQRLGYEYIAITDHSQSLAITNGLNEERLLRHIDEIRNWQAANNSPVRVLAGSEVDILADGSLDYPDSLLEQLDVVIASIHSRFNMTADEMTRRICRAIENPHVDILAHPTGRLLLRRNSYPLDIDAVFETARRSKTALELNSDVARLDLNDVHCYKARTMGIPVVISSDAHQAKMLGALRFGVHTARRGWLEPSDVLNARPLPQLLEFLRRTL
ncbi:MAG TPA: DNA polymerase/3'-5' exonuclease PolX [Acidobacteriota bacterium]|jgi:DNA polymerase (family 10)